MKRSRVKISQLKRHGGMSGYISWESRGYCEEVRGIVKDVNIIFTEHNRYSLTSFFVDGEKYEIWGEGGVHLGIYLMEGDEVILHLSKYQRVVAIQFIRDNKLVHRYILEQGGESHGSTWYNFED